MKPAATNLLAAKGVNAAQHTDDHVLVIGASGGIGKAFCQSLRSRGCHVETLSRRDDGFDITDGKSIENAAASFAANGLAFSHIIVATGILDISDDDHVMAGPEKSFRDLDADNAIRAFQVNALGPALVFRHFAPLMAKSQRAIFAALSARVGSIGDNRLGGWMSYRASKAALNQFIRCASIEHQRGHPNHIVIALHPGTIATKLTEKYAKGRYTNEPVGAADQMFDTLSALTPAQSGGFFSYDGSAIEW